MTQQLASDERISAELAHNMARCAENNLRHEKDTNLIQYLLNTAKDDSKSLISQILGVKEVQQIIVDFLGIPLVVPE